MKILLDLAGGVALLLWGLHMVQSGIVRAFGAELRVFLSRSLGNRFAAFGAGLGLTALLQSSTATGLMTASFASEGAIALVPALAIMLGANVGTTLIVQLLSFDISTVAPVLFVLGLIAFRNGTQNRLKNLGRVAIGLGLMLLALHILINTLEPAENTPAMRTLMRAVTSDPYLCVLLGAVLTWAAHSSVATVLLIMSLGYANFIAPEAILALVIGANIGSAVNPIFEGSQRGNPSSYRLPLGNLLNRLAGAIAFVPILPWLIEVLVPLQPNMSKLAAEFHVGFNVVLAIVFMALLDPLAWLVTKILPSKQEEADPSLPRYLDDSALDTPSLALADAARETLRVGDYVETMLRQVMDALSTNDRALVATVSRSDNIVDRLDEAIKLYLTKLTRQSLDEREGRRAMEIISFTINLEHIGDIIDKNLSELAAKKIKRKIEFSLEGAAELADFHKQILESLRVAFGVFMSGDVVQARHLIAQKATIRAIELAAADRHFERLREGRPESIETTSLHLDILRDLKRIHSHICSVAYPVIDAARYEDVAESDPITLVNPLPEQK